MAAFLGCLFLLAEKPLLGFYNCGAEETEYHDSLI